MEKKKHNCYTCQHRRPIPGNTHSACKAGNPPPPPSKTPTIDAYGASQGWAAWPYNFDPVWIKRCELYQPDDPDQPT